MFDLNRPMGATRAEAVRIATQEVGKPTAERIREYHSSAIGKPWVGPSAEWCGLFCLWALHESGIATDVLWKIGGGFCEEQHLPRVKLPEPGDIAYYAHPFQHHALVYAVDEAAGTIETIDGNQGGDTVAHKTHVPLSKPTCFYSIAKLLPGERDTDPGGDDGTS